MILINLKVDFTGSRNHHLCLQMLGVTEMPAAAYLVNLEWINPPTNQYTKPGLRNEAVYVIYAIGEVSASALLQIESNQLR